ncbi:MAG: UDP-2,4-diacetamido-2,4,6-trideoxy-beta-L-altropyranose hydrolase [Candidatus Omnitrophica bacterium]|nr:UDP-2,4-diacetamido-2,4,6-trideoxy-beta-L-altropyranose hydrolase [Candidatus Omnitrophota bacterium]
MKACFRVDSSNIIGSGHVMRCLAFADELRRLKVKISFICRKFEGDLIDFIAQKGYKVHCLPHCRLSRMIKKDPDPYKKWLGADWQNDAAQTLDIVNLIKPDWIIVDHYAIGRNWEKKLKTAVNKVMSIDDLANRSHECDILLDQNLYAGMRLRYKRLLPEGCKELLGPEFALLRPEFRKARAKSRCRDGKVKKILVFFGGVDLANETQRVLEALVRLKRADISVDVAVGINNPHKIMIESLIKKMPNLTCYNKVRNISKLMRSADLFIGTAGITTWERCCLGLPSLVITIARNQVKIIKYLAKKNILFYIGESHKVKSARIQKDIEYFLTHPRRLKRYSLNSLKLVDGLGALRCAKTLIQTN